jgi:hypothetical protein
VIDTALDPPVPRLLQDVLPAPVGEPDQDAGPFPDSFAVEKEPFLTLFPCTTIVRTAELLSSFASRTSWSSSAVARISCSP